MSNSLRSLRIVLEGKTLVGPYHCLHGAVDIHAKFFRLTKQQAGADQRDDDARGTQREKKLSSFSIHQDHSADGEKKIHERENDIAPVRLHIRKAAL